MSMYYVYKIHIVLHVLQFHQVKKREKVKDTIRFTKKEMTEMTTMMKNQNIRFHKTINGTGICRIYRFITAYRLIISKDLELIVEIAYVRDEQ